MRLNRNYFFYLILLERAKRLQRLWEGVCPEVFKFTFRMWLFEYIDEDTTCPQGLCKSLWLHSFIVAGVPGN